MQLCFLAKMTKLTGFTYIGVCCTNLGSVSQDRSTFESPMGAQYHRGSRDHSNEGHTPVTYSVNTRRK